MALVKEWKSLLSVAQWRNEWFKREPKNKNRQERAHKPAEGSEGFPVDKYKLVEHFQTFHCDKEQWNMDKSTFRVPQNVYFFTIKYYNIIYATVYHRHSYTSVLFFEITERFTNY